MKDKDLPPRLLQVLNLMANGHNARGIGEALGAGGMVSLWQRVQGRFPCWQIVITELAGRMGTQYVLDLIRRAQCLRQPSKD